MMPMVLDDDLIYPESPYLFSVKTPGGFAEIAVDETQWDIAAPFKVRAFGSSAARMFLKLHFERYGIDLQGKAIDLDDRRLSPEAIFSTLSRQDQEKDYITAFELLSGHQPDALPDSFIIPETGDGAGERSQAEPVFESADSKPVVIDQGIVLESAVSFKQKKSTLADRYQFQGLPISVENKAGSVRRGVDPDGHEWKTKMHFDYGYIRRTEGEDGEGIDVYVGKDRNAQHVYIVKQHQIEAIKVWGSEYCPDCKEHVHDCGCKKYYDEDKVLIGFTSKKAAIEAYNKQYDSPLFLGPVSTMTVESFRDLVTGEKVKIQIPLQLVAEDSADCADSAGLENASDWRDKIRKAKSLCDLKDSIQEALAQRAEWQKDVYDQAMSAGLIPFKLKDRLKIDD